MNTPVLDLLILDTFSPLTLGIGDISIYPSGWNIVSPTIYITPPNFPEVTQVFTANNINIFNSNSLGITCSGDPIVNLPDGIYNIKYTINPAYKYFVEKTIYKVDNLMEKFDEAFMKLDIMQCDGAIKKVQKDKINHIYFYIQGAIAAANKCATELANDMYKKACKELENFIQNQKCYG